MERNRAFVGTFLLAVAAAAPAFADSSEFPWLYERKIQGENNLESVRAVLGTEAYDYARVVARVERIDGEPFCTGSRVGENLFLTNFHCDQPCDSFQFTMGVEADVPETEMQTFRCAKLVRKNETLDYALYEVTPFTPDGAPDNEAGYPILKLWNGPVVEGTKLVVPSHPSGRLKEIDRSDECVLTSIEPFMTPSGRNTIKHMCDTEGGSSGAPVLDRATGFAVALHWGGKDDEYNMAIPMSLILGDLKDNVPADTYEALDIQE